MSRMYWSVTTTVTDLSCCSSSLLIDGSAVSMSPESSSNGDNFKINAN